MKVPNSVAFPISYWNANSQILVRNSATGNIESTSAFNLLKNSGYGQTDTLLAWPSRNYIVSETANDIFINGRIGAQSNSDSLVLTLPSPVLNKEINIYVQNNAKLWVMDIILNSSRAFDEGNGLTTNFVSPKNRYCFEFGVAANNTAYNGDLVPASTGQAFKITLNYNPYDFLWSVTRVVRQ
jgi:hypothetical protein